ncbi:hypothetical protein [Serratia marcescens]|uniref:hypothetical protein n=1 Tax=Serratia marcescens TaxID=615 RepID=UPI00274D708A|nr:hypothetical protein [Serratia marcescens]MDP8824080.1 hypothetical protein [Serratia marcescens]
MQTPDLPVAVPDRGLISRSDTDRSAFSCSWRITANETLKCNRLILKYLYLSVGYIFILLSVERQPKAVLTQSENGKFVIFQSPIPSAYSFSPSMPKAAAIARQPPGFHCFFLCWRA